MKIFGKKSVSTLFRKLISLALYGQVLFLAFILVFAVSDDDPSTTKWPVTMDVPYRSVTTTPKIDGIENIQIHESEHEELRFNKDKKILVFSDNTLGRKLLRGLHVLLVFGIPILITILLRRIFLALEEQNPFLTENVARVRWISYLLIAQLPISIVYSLIERFYIDSEITLQGARLYFWNIEFSVTALFSALLILIVAEIFQTGTNIKEENNSIV